MAQTKVPFQYSSRVGIAINFIILLFFICKGTHYSPFFSYICSHIYDSL